jgi:hypothetical protein
MKKQKTPLSALAYVDMDGGLHHTTCPLLPAEIMLLHLPASLLLQLHIIAYFFGICNPLQLNNINCIFNSKFFRTIVYIFMDQYMKPNNDIRIKGTRFL